MSPEPARRWSRRRWCFALLPARHHFLSRFSALLLCLLALHSSTTIRLLRTLRAMSTIEQKSFVRDWLSKRVKKSQSATIAQFSTQSAEEPTIRIASLILSLHLELRVSRKVGAWLSLFRFSRLPMKKGGRSASTRCEKN